MDWAKRAVVFGGVIRCVTARSALVFCALNLAAATAWCSGVSTSTALVRHAPTVNGTVEGCVQQMLPESMTLNGGGVITRDLYAPGAPVVRLNGKPAYQGTIDATGSSFPAGYQITLNGGATLGHVVRKVDPTALPEVNAPMPPKGKRTVVLSSAGQTVGDFSTVRDLTVNGNLGSVAVPPGAYGDFSAGGGSGFVLGTPGSTTPAVYHFQRLTLNGSSHFHVVGPVAVTVAHGFTASGNMGASQRPDWLMLGVYSGDFTLNGGVSLWGTVQAPRGHVIINGHSQLIGGLACDRLTVNGRGLLRIASSAWGNRAPVAAS